MARWATVTHMMQSLLTKKAGTLASPDPALLALFGATPSLSGASVNADTAMGVPAVSNAVSLIADAIGTLPAKVFSRQTTGDKEVNSSHPACAVVHDNANDWTSANQLRTQITVDALLHGNGYAFANRVNGKVIELIRLDPSAVTPQLDSATGEPSYIVKEGNTKRVLSFRDVLHIPALTGADGMTGISPIYFAREAIGLAIVLEGHAAKLFARGGRPTGLLKFAKRLDVETAKRISESWHASHSGDASGKTAVLEEGADFQPLTFNSVDSQFEELRHFQIHEIARAFRVQPVLLMEMDRATWSNSEEMNRQFLQFTLLPWLRKWEAAYSRVLLNPDERGSTSIEFVLDDLLRADTATRTEAYAKFRAMGVMTGNEVRKLENLPPHADGDTLQNPYTTTQAPQVAA